MKRKKRVAIARDGGFQGLHTEFQAADIPAGGSQIEQNARLRIAGARGRRRGMADTGNSDTTGAPNAVSIFTRRDGVRRLFYSTRAGTIEGFAAPTPVWTT